MLAYAPREPSRSWTRLTESVKATSLTGTGSELEAFMRGFYDGSPASSGYGVKVSVSSATRARADACTA